MYFQYVNLNVKYPKVSLVTFFTYVYTGDDHVLTAEKAFVCLTLFDIIRMPLAMLPMLIVYMIEVKYIDQIGGICHALLFRTSQFGCKRKSMVFTSKTINLFQMTFFYAFWRLCEYNKYKYAVMLYVLC